MMGSIEVYICSSKLKSIFRIWRETSYSSTLYSSFILLMV